MSHHKYNAHECVKMPPIIHTFPATLPLSKVLSVGNEAKEHNINMCNNRITNLGFATTDSDAISLSQAKSLMIPQDLQSVLNNGNGVGSNNINMNYNRIINVGNAVNPNDAISLNQAENLLAASQILETVLSHGNSAGNISITNLGTAVNSTDAINLGQAQSLISATQNLSNILANGNSAGNNSITNLGTAVNSTDAINLGQAQSLIGGAQSLSTVLSHGNSAGSIDIDMNNNSVRNANTIEVANLNEQTPGKGIMLFTNYSIPNFRAMYPFTGTINSNTLQTLLTIPLQPLSSYTSILVGGYYYNDNVGNYYYSNAIKASATFLIIANQISSIYTDIPGVNVYMDMNGTDLLVNVINPSSFTIETSGTIDLWKH